MSKSALTLKTFVFRKKWQKIQGTRWKSRDKQPGSQKSLGDSSVLSLGISTQVLTQHSQTSFLARQFPIPLANSQSLQNVWKRKLEPTLHFPCLTAWKTLLYSTIDYNPRYHSFLSFFFFFQKNVSNQ